jgi:hypothetical protein
VHALPILQVQPVGGVIAELEVAAEVVKQGESYRQLSFAKPKPKKKKGVKA